MKDHATKTAILRELRQDFVQCCVSEVTTAIISSDFGKFDPIFSARETIDHYDAWFDFAISKE